MKIKVHKIKCKDLNAGDLFSTADQVYWEAINNNQYKSIGEKVYIRTIQPCPENQAEDDIYRITVYQYD